MSDPFAQYKLPMGLVDGVDIPLTGTPAVFKVRLPGNMNEEFNMELMSRMQSDVQPDGTVKVNAIRFQRERKRLFFEECVIDCSGLPEGMDKDAFFATYPLAAKAVYERAQELANLADTEAEEALGKLENLPNGKPSGKASTNSTKTSSKAA